MIRIALTGSIGMGKSTVARMFEAAGVPVFDADAEVRRMQAPGGTLEAPICATFPNCCSDGHIDRDRLANEVLADPSALAKLERIVHPKVHEARTAFVLKHADAPALLFDIPLLFETGGAPAFDAVIVVSAPAEVQRKRVLSRTGMTAERLDSILARQVPDADKRAQADFVIETCGEIAETERQVDSILSCLGLVAGQ